MTRKTSSSSQRGAVLVTTVILLVMLTILALAAVSMNSTQTRIATNSYDSLTAYQTAEAALTQAETDLWNGIYDPSDFAGNTAGLYVFDTSAAPLWATNLNNAAWWQSATNAKQGFTGKSAQPAAYVIERLPPVSKPGQGAGASLQVYRVTARAIGASNSPVVLQGTLQVE